MHHFLVVPCAFHPMLQYGCRLFSNIVTSLRYIGNEYFHLIDFPSCSFRQFPVVSGWQDLGVHHCLEFTKMMVHKKRKVSGSVTSPSFSTSLSLIPCFPPPPLLTCMHPHSLISMIPPFDWAVVLPAFQSSPMLL